MAVAFGQVAAQIPEPTRTYLADDGLVPRERFFDFKQLDLELAFEPEKGLVKGTVRHTFSPLRNELKNVQLDAPGIRVKTITLDGQTCTWKSAAKMLDIAVPEGALTRGKDYQLTIEYEANPKKGIYFIGWNDPLNLSRKQIWTQGQGIDNRHWIPMFDDLSDKVVSNLTVNMPEGYKVLSNGQRSKPKNNKDGTWTWAYRMEHQHPPYLIMLGIGKYEIKETQSASGIPMYLYYYPEWEDRVEATYRYSEAMFDWFEQELGVPYPWGSYSQIPVQDFMYGAMENTTATLFGDFFFVDDRSYHDRNYVAVNAHELAHQWFGDYVTARSSAHHWLQESFATYYNTLYEKEAFGQDHYDWKRRQAVLQSLNASKKDHRPIANSRAGSTRHYPKGAHVLHMLRHLVGDELYRASIKHYLQKHPYGSVDSEDLLVAFYEVSGQPLNWFWEEWVYRGGEPEYQVSFEEVERSGRRFSEFTVEQVHQQTEVVGLFDMPMVFQVHYKDGTSSEEQHRIFEARQTVALANPENKEVAYVLFDPNSEVIKKVRFSKSTVMLMEQAEKATHMLDRYDALVALRSVPMAQKKPLYQRIWTNNDYHEVLGELIFQALNDDAPEWMIELAMAHENVQVQKHLARHLKTIDVNWIKTLEPLLTNPSYVTVEIALEKLCVASPTQAGQFLAACDGVMGTRGRNVRIKWLEMALNFQHDSKYEKELIEYTSVSYEFLTRTAAAQACVRLSLFNENVFQYLANGAGAYNRRLKGPCRQALREFYKEPIYRSMIRKYVAEGTWNADMQRFWDRLLG